MSQTNLVKWHVLGIFSLLALDISPWAHRPGCGHASPMSYRWAALCTSFHARSSCLGYIHNCSTWDVPPPILLPGRQLACGAGVCGERFKCQGVLISEMYGWCNEEAHQLMVMGHAGVAYHKRRVAFEQCCLTGLAACLPGWLAAAEMPPTAPPVAVMTWRKQ